MYAIEYTEAAEDDLKGLRAFDRAQILDRIDAELTHLPKQTKRQRKPLPGLIPPWEHTPPIWQLRVGEHRVFYDVDESKRAVTIRAIRYKPPHKTTEDTL